MKFCNKDRIIRQLLNYCFKSNRKSLLLCVFVTFVAALFCGVDDRESMNLYLDKLQSLSEHHLQKEQKLWIENFYLNNKNRDPLRKERHKIRKEFGSKKHRMKQEWETKYNLKWPQVRLTPKNAAAVEFEAHHVIPIHAGGINESRNISPLTSKNHHLLHESLEEKACFSHDFILRIIIRFILKIQIFFTDCFEG
jgi:hypothetical protein